MLSSIRLVVVCACALGAAPTAQSVVAYPQDTRTHSLGDVVPFGSDPSSAIFEEGRWQQFVPNTHLPTAPTMITGMAALCQGYTGPILYARLRITLSHNTTGRVFTAFASNLVTPVVVLNRQSQPVSWQAGQWTTIPFDTPFFYDGQSDLVVDIQKEATPIAGGSIAQMAASSDPGRSDLFPVIYAFGPRGSGAFNASGANATRARPLQIRLIVPGPTLTLTSDRLSSGSRNVFALTGMLDVGVYAPLGSSFVAWVDTSFTGRFRIPGVTGEGVVAPAVVLPLRQVTNRPTLWSLQIPRDASLVDVPLRWQAAVVGAAGSLEFTNAADCIIRDS
jgi:hypothetical protein